MKKIELGTDGACAGNPGPGGWGYISSTGDVQGYGSEKHTTNQRMELTAVGRGLLALGTNPAYRHVETVVVLTDSRYIVDCINQRWYKGWIKRGWRTSSGAPVKNEKLWRALLKLVAAWEKRGATVEFKWVKGHAGHLLNEAADKLAVKGRDEAKKL